MEYIGVYIDPKYGPMPLYEEERDFDNAEVKTMELIKMLDEQPCPGQAHNEMMAIVQASDSQYMAFRRAFEYGRIVGKREDRQRRKRK